MFTSGHTYVPVYHDLAKIYLLFTGTFFVILVILHKILLFSLVSEMTNHSIVMLRRLQASKTFVCVYKILCFCANLQKLVPAKIVTLR